MPDQIIVHEGTFQPAQEKTYIHLPFDVPVDATRLDVTYTYSDKIGASPLLTGGNTIDLGVFDPRGIDFLSAGFRGWSGSERSSFFITAREATPGYLAGPLTPGHWHLLLGLYKISPAGCSYRVTITITPGNQTTEQIPVPLNDLPASPPRAPFSPWLRGELHCHTWHSDGDRSATEITQLARSRALDFLAITDHNTTASQRELADLREPGLILIRGVEVTAYTGHFCAWGIPDWIDFRIQTPGQMAAALQQAKEHGALTSCNHPEPLGPPWDFESVTNFDCIEVWNGLWSLRNEIALGFWTNLLATGRRIPALGGSDWHRPKAASESPQRTLGTPTVWVFVSESPSPSVILAALRRGHVALSDQPNGALLDLRAGAAMSGDLISRPIDDTLVIQVRCQRGAGNQLRLLDQNGVLFEQRIAQTDETIATQLSSAPSLYVRAELRTPGDTLKAMTNPIYLRDR